MEKRRKNFSPDLNPTDMQMKDVSELLKDPAAEAAPAKLLQADKRIDKRLLQTFRFIFQQQEKQAELNKPQYWISFRKWPRLITSESMRNQEATGDHFLSGMLSSLIKWIYCTPTHLPQKYFAYMKTFLIRDVSFAGTSGDQTES